MLELITEKIKVAEEVQALIIEKRDNTRDKEDRAYYHGIVVIYDIYIATLKELEREYEENVQSLEESMRFLRGE